MFLPISTISPADVGSPPANEADTAAQTSNDYILERGDVLCIAVWQNQELTPYGTRASGW
jgi:protein involved in polysaccharide export with SLBB domain